MVKPHQIAWAALDHVVITCADLEKSVAFYGGGLGMVISRLDDGRIEATFGRCKLNLQPANRHFGPPRNAGRSWSANICLLVEHGLSDVESHLREIGLRIEEGPVARVGAQGTILSLYLYDPDGNLIEISEYPSHAKKI